MFRAGRTVWRFVYLCSCARRVSGGVVVAAATGGAMVYKILCESPVKLREALDTSSFLAKTITPLKELQARSDAIPTKMELMIMDVQSDLVNKLQKIEAQYSDAKFRIDRWERQEGGGGIACVLQDGKVFEKAGVNVSVVQGALPPEALQHMKARGKDFGEPPFEFKAMGISSVIHPRNPNVPTVHFNYRYFEVTDIRGRLTWWFGGGSDLTPYYLNRDDVRHFHQTLKNACGRHSPRYYSEFKKWCDNYFYIKHRGFARGVGGIFFDDLVDKKPENIFKFVEECARSVSPSYIPLVLKNKDKGYGYRERDWQLVRRGHYAEFNLVYDRGTKFGLFTPGARYEAILMSLPLNARWYYEHEPEPGSEESILLETLKKPIDWV
ncbi:oxygen-dependent coproporphyrinogen-III oxidase-like [Varroa jacobsoni]|uniref:coproporphyrinogen oxidase n=1 Tax=Varroa destructor TaxID=109461 RepID=A0A7M7KEK3_VARDE|nr:oxygen-dependent coproporphyrinogen-III oxidase-like [Varroa destructor]XP_022665622.1 oxygen-dependent coproporphyrinogen-III oxidase-like [Varroa destructor]XP_022665623.1 oxygen-dependent coproporphyrinogen-III oxidase-like [Varroa destructor]XP_022698628.1 oxygen-dependent coproporphyrinogen-III oxidase-like [Varroa jacobsoni]